MNRFKWIALALTVSLMALPALALGQGGAAGDQYGEQAPSAGGGSGGLDGSGTSTSSGPSGTSGTAANTTSSGPLDSATVKQLKQSDADGAAAADLAQKTAPNSDALREAAKQAQLGNTDATDGVFAAPGDTSSSSDGGMGIALPIILVLVLLAGIAYAWWRRRGGSTSTGGLRERLRLRRRDVPERS